MDDFCRDLLDKALRVNKVVRFADLQEPHESHDDIMESAFSHGTHIRANKRKFEDAHQDIPIKGQLPLASKISFLSVVKNEAGGDTSAAQQLDNSSIVTIFRFAGDAKRRRIAWKESMHHSFQMF